MVTARSARWPDMIFQSVITVQSNWSFYYYSDRLCPPLTTGIYLCFTTTINFFGVAFIPLRRSRSGSGRQACSSSLPALTCNIYQAEMWYWSLVTNEILIWETPSLSTSSAFELHCHTTIPHVCVSVGLQNETEVRWFNFPLLRLSQYSYSQVMTIWQSKPFLIDDIPIH